MTATSNATLLAAAIDRASKSLNKPQPDVLAFVQQSGGWEADSAEDLAALIVSCWREQDGIAHRRKIAALDSAALSNREAAVRWWRSLFPSDCIEYAALVAANAPRRVLKDWCEDHGGLRCFPQRLPSDILAERVPQ